MNESQYKPITGMINVNDIQEIIENNRFYQEEIERLKEKIIRLNIKNLELTSIIKEVREYIELYTNRLLNQDIAITPIETRYLLEILDKEKE